MTGDEALRAVARDTAAQIVADWGHDRVRLEAAIAHLAEEALRCARCAYAREVQGEPTRQ